MLTPNGDTAFDRSRLADVYPWHVGNRSKAKIKHYGLKGIEPGDILVTEQYTTGSHLGRTHIHDARLSQRQDGRLHLLVCTQLA